MGVKRAGSVAGMNVCTDTRIPRGRYYVLHPGRVRDVTVRGRWTRIAYREAAGEWRIRHYYRRVRVPWLAWAMFS